MLGNLLQRHFNRLITVQKNSHIQYCAAVLVAVRRGIAPAAAPINSQGQLYSVLVIYYPCKLIIFQALYCRFHYNGLYCLKAFLRLALRPQNRSDIIMQTQSVAEVCRTQSFLQPFPLNLRKALHRLQLLCRRFMSYCFCDLIHLHQLTHTLVPCNYRIRVCRIEARAKRFP